jgi:eukaryotic-like serine/threonine-protein kinase
VAHARAVAELPAGTVLAGRYRVERAIGSGGMGAVYAVFDEQLGETVALKLMALGEDPRAIARFRREVVVARRITHANVARTHDIGEHEGKLFLTMELIEGESLEHRLERAEPLSLAEALDIVAAVARGLSAAHEAGIVHRDLKPANVLIEATGRVAITDFGVARPIVDGGGKASQIVGTPYYMAPEQILGEAISAAADVYALGLVLYELVCSRPPFEGDASMASLLARCRERPIDPRRQVDMSDALAEIILRCLALDPADRPPAREVASRLVAPEVSAASSATVVATSASWPGDSASVSHPFAPLKIGSRSLAVLPFSYRGPADHDYLGESLSQELIDVLSRLRGMRVLAFGATRSVADRDPRAVGRSLEVDAMIDGGVTASGDRVRVAVRLVDVASGEQLWSDRFEGDLGDVFKMQETISQRIAETLRVELTVAAHRDEVGAEAMDAYLRARRELEQRHYHGATQAVALLERSVAASPTFRPALAAHALASVRAWWMAFFERSERDWSTVASDSVARALEGASDLAESHLAAAVLALNRGDLKTTARELAEALAIAPTCADAQRYLGDIQCEAGRVNEGLRRLDLAIELDPTLFTAWYSKARVAALHGDFERFDRYMARAVDIVGAADPPVLIMAMRAAIWRDDRAAIATLTRRFEQSTLGVGPPMVAFGRYLLGELEVDAIDLPVTMVVGAVSARMASLIGQLIIEAYTYRGDLDDAMRWLRKIGGEALVDVEWLERCPPLAPLRAQPGFREVLAQSRERAQQIWQV